MWPMCAVPGLSPDSLTTTFVRAAPAVAGAEPGLRRLIASSVEALEAALRGRGIDRVLLETGEDQVEAVRLYERCGYARRGAFGGYPDNGLSLFYEKRL